ncbi:hypothetical protein [Uliginosibacterium sp. 31-12]|uniref:hypothetical protein n=1 Tax=Uliginosibacterium sp. 31-12 TaxID=3062781 RepID=UPI0026E19ABF|nr:hypothetical protein [Uliginosibacterium sp. 31-12]MDO6386520.1 hypothetical protein [Uliginosibacterium sp. 31-12]
MTAKFIVALAAFYHLMATVAAMMAIFHFARVLRGEESSHPVWRYVFNWGEAHLWISGAILISVGIYLNGLSEYLNNPKLWTKVSLVLLWGLNSWGIRKTIQTASALRRKLMFGISAGCLLYGSFLGVAKPLAYGVLPFPWFLAGFLATIAACTYGVSRLFPLPSTANV